MASMASNLLTLALVLCFSAPAPAVCKRSDETTREAFAAAAGQIHMINYGSVMSSRDCRSPFFPDSNVLADLFERRDAPEALLPLLADPDAKVRTLAMLALYQREDPHLLPRFVALVGDRAVTFPEPHPSQTSLPGQDVRVDARTVGFCASKLVENYLGKAGFHYGVDGQGTEPGFEMYWSERKDRSLCASWLLIKQERAFSGASPSLQERLPPLREVRAEVDRLPPADRALMLLWLPDCNGSFATVAERIEAARSLGRETLLAILQRNVPSTDPDLLPRAGSHGGEYACAGIARFVLRHARELLLPEDAPTLLAIGAHERDSSASLPSDPMNWATWDIGAASLEPAKARKTLETAYLRYGQKTDSQDELARAELMQAYWLLCPGGDTDERLASWFYGETLSDSFSPPSRCHLVRLLGEDGSPRAHATLARLVRDPAFAHLDVETLDEMAAAVNRWIQPEILSSGELWNLQPRLGKGFRQPMRTPAQIEAAAKRSPEATRAFLAELERWRTRIRESLPLWEPGEKK
jgi:hypothetical protein